MYQVIKSYYESLREESEDEGEEGWVNQENQFSFISGPFHNISNWYRKKISEYE